MHKAKHYRGGYDVAGLANLARQLSKEQTRAEALLWQLLRNRQMMGFKFRRQHQFGDYVADFYCHEAQLVVEWDGAVHEGNERWQHDQARDTYLTGHGLRVLRFTNSQVLENTEITLKEISRYLQVPLDRRWREAEDR